MPSVDELFVGKVGQVFATPYGTTAPATFNGSFDIEAAKAALSATWTGGDLGFLHESDTPEFGFDVNSTTITAWQADGNVLRTIMNQKVRSVTFTCRAFNRNVWDILEPGTVWTTGANGSFSGTIPTNGGNPPRAFLFEIEDLDAGYLAWWYIPRCTVASIGGFKAANTDTMNAVITLNFEVIDTNTPLYTIAGNLPGMAP